MKNELRHELNLQLRPKEGDGSITGQLSVNARRTIELVSNNLDTDERSIWEISEMLLPLVNFITQPRSINEFRCLKDFLLEEVVTTRLYSKHNPRFWLFGILEHFHIFADMGTKESVHKNVIGRKNRLLYNEQVNLGHHLLHSRKIHFNQLVKVSKFEEKMGNRTGLIIGKWRALLTSDHLDTIHQARGVLGRNGRLYVIIEGKESIGRREGEDKFCDDDEERVKRLMYNNCISKVCLCNTKTSKIKMIDEYWEGVWCQVAPHYYFLGSKKDKLRPVFEERAKKLGIILLWNRDTDKVSTTKLIKQIQGLL